MYFPLILLSALCDRLDRNFVSYFIDEEKRIRKVKQGCTASKLYTGVSCPPFNIRKQEKLLWAARQCKEFPPNPSSLVL